MTERDGVRVDMHVKVLDERVVRRAKARGIDVLVYAPHFTRLPAIEATAERFSDDDLLVVPAREVFTGNWRNRRHVLALGLSEPVPDFITLEAAIREFRRQEAAVLVPHPGFLNVSVGERALGQYRDVVDAVEVYNAKLPARSNRAARTLAARHDCEGFGSSYAHLVGTIGEAWTTFERPVDDADDLVEALRAGADRAVEHRRGVRHRLRCAAEFAHLGYENTWQKLDRLFLSGTEPTHPHHIAYDGRFDAASVY